MAKKVRRAKKKSQQKRETVADDTSTKVEVSEHTSNSHQSTVDQFQLDYAYVVRDLRRVLILAAVMFALLIALNLLLR